MARQRILSLRLSEDEYSQLQSEAVEADRSINWLIRQRVFTPVSESPSMTPTRRTSHRQAVPPPGREERSEITSRPQMDAPIATSPTIRPEAEKTPTWAQRNSVQAKHDDLLSRINKPKKS